jgi:predicted ester cyclase
VVQGFTFEGTHDGTLSGPAGEIPATHRRLNGRGVQIFRVEGDAVVDTRLYFDQVQIMTQLGLMPEPTPAY